MGVVVFINGEGVAPEDAHVSVFDRGLLYGDSVFETLGTYGGKPFAVMDHVRRLRRSAELVFIDLAVSDEQLAGEIDRAIEQSGNRESYVRLIVTRGSGELGLDPSLAANPQRILIVTPLHRPDAATYDRGVKAVTFKVQRSTDGTPAEGAKIGNYLVAVLAMQKARAASANEALIVDSRSNLIEGASSNLFWVKDQKLRTPPESMGILPGITRAVVLTAARDLGLGVIEACPTLHELGELEELFITSSIRQLLSVVTVDETTIGTGRPGPFYRRLFERFQQLVRRD